MKSLGAGALSPGPGVVGDLAAAAIAASRRLTSPFELLGVVGKMKRPPGAGLWGRLAGQYWRSSRLNS